MAARVTEQLVQFPAGEEVLAGRYIRAKGSSRSPGLLLLHGAGTATKERAQPLVSHLAAAYGISSFSFDFSGHGASTGTLTGSSLRKRVEEALAAVRYAGFKEPIGVCAFSMGCHIALELLAHVPIRTLVLFYPAVYATDAFDITFGPEFTAVLRTPGSWRSSRVFDLVRKYEGSILVVMGEKDEVIPSEIPHRLLDSAEHARAKQLIVIPGAPHLMLPELLASSEWTEKVCSTISGYVG